MWFSAAHEIDRRIKERFETDMERYAMGEYSGWQYDRDGRLAIILLISKMTRNFYRKDGAMAFGWDQ